MEIYLIEEYSINNVVSKYVFNLKSGKNTYKKKGVEIYCNMKIIHRYQNRNFIFIIIPPWLISFYRIPVKCYKYRK